MRTPGKLAWLSIATLGCTSTPPAAAPQAEPIPVTVAVPAPASAVPLEHADEPPREDAAPSQASAPEVDPPPSKKREQAKAVFRAGADAYSQGDYAGAAQLFRESYDLSDEPLLLFNIARAEMKAGRTREACDAMRLFLRRAPGSGSGVDTAKDMMKQHCRP